MEEFEYDDGSWTNAAISSFGIYGNFLGRYGQGFTRTNKNFAVPTDAEKLTLQFLLYEIDEWEDDDQVKVQIGGTEIDLGQFTYGATLQNDEYNGEVNGIVFERLIVNYPSNIAFGSANDQIHKVKFTIPREYYQGGILAVGFEVCMHAVISNESAGFDKLIITAHFDCETSSPTSSPSLSGPSGPSGQPCEDTEFVTDTNTAADGWDNAVYSVSDDGSYHFLGRYGKDSALPKRTLNVPTDADEIKLEFLFFEIDKWETSDRMYLKINGITVDMGQMSKNGDEDLSPYEGAGTGIVLTRVPQSTSSTFVGTARHWDQIHRVEVTIERGVYYSSGTLTVEFSCVFNHEISNESFGVSDFKATAIGSCSAGSGRRRDLLTSVHRQGGLQSFIQHHEDDEVVGEPDMNGDDGEGPYCLAEDFPCNGGDMVYVCHYSTRRGYQTFCIPESDSDILRFYSKDYCGPCVGGYGGLNWS